MLRWARSEGAQYIISNKPEAHAVLVFTVDDRFATWTFHTALYEKPIPIELWQLNPPSGAPPQPESSIEKHR
jgi:hypothetical protein